MSVVHMSASSASGARRRRFAPMLAALTCLAALSGLAACGSDKATVQQVATETVTVLHAATPAPTLVDASPAGPSVGDVRIFHFPGRTDAGVEVSTDWLMTTTATDSPAAGVETRMTNAVFHFGGKTDDALVLEGVAFYPGEQATLKAADTIHRAIVGGAGVYAGATGEVVSTHLPDGSWKHVFTIER